MVVKKIKPEIKLEKGIYLSNFGVQDQRLIDYLAYNFKLDDDGVSLSGKLSPHAVQFLTGNWLEVLSGVSFLNIPRSLISGMFG